MRVRTRLLEFLFPVETDSWLTVLRIGLGLEVTLYSLSLRDDWVYLFRELHANWRKHYCLWKVISFPGSGGWLL